MKRKRSVPLSKWLEQVVCLPAGIAAVPGPIRLHAYQRAICDALADPALPRVSILKSARIGFTTALVGSIAHYIVREPSSILVLMPTESDCRGLMVDDIEGLFVESPKLKDHLPMPHPGRSDRNTLLHRLFRGGSLKIVSGKAPRNLRRHSARVLLIDELDAVEASAEGDPVSLAEKRTLSFDDRKIICGSTPIDETTSHICRLYAHSDQRIYEIPCPSCGAFAEIRWADIEWPEGKPEEAAWRCPHCRELIPESHKAKMVAAGAWRATHPEVKQHAGFRLSSLISLLHNARWGTLAAEFLQARNDTDTLKVFVTTVLGEPWREQADEIDQGELIGRVEGFDLDHIPEQVLAITGGCDVQMDRLKTSIVGHARDGTAFVLAHTTTWGSPHDDDTWRELDVLLQQRWRHPHGGALKIDAAVIDAGDGGVFDTVLKFSQTRLGRRVLAGKGAAGFGRPAIQLSKSRKGKLFIIGVDALKSQLLTRLARGRSIRFSHVLDSNYFEQLTAERRVVRMSRGRPVVRFERKIGQRAEALDSLVYATAAKAALALNAAAFDQRETALRMTEPDNVPPPTVIRSQWMDRGRWR
jgi:phage terminase large subunit GpA-like protein